jgi:transposase
VILVLDIVRLFGSIEQVESMSAGCPDVDRLSRTELQTLVHEQSAQLRIKNEQLRVHQLQIEQLKATIAKLKRLQFGQKSEKLTHDIEQLQLLVDALESADAPLPVIPKESAQAVEPTEEKADRSVSKPRRAMPAQLPREERIIAPQQTCCPDCGAMLKAFGEDSAEMLERESVVFKVIRTVRPKLACLRCDVIVQAPAPPRPLDRCIAGPGLLAHVVASKYADHLPLYRQSEIYAREGVPLDRSLLAQWVRGVTELVQPLTDALRAHVLAAHVLHVDDTPVPVLAPGTGKTKTGRLWTYVRDERPAAGTSAPAVWFTYSPDRKGEHPQQHLQHFTASFRPTVMPAIPSFTRVAV